MSKTGVDDRDPANLDAGDPRNLEQGSLSPGKIPPSHIEIDYAEMISESFFREWVGELCGKPYSFNYTFFQQIPDSLLTESKDT